MRYGNSRVHTAVLAITAFVALALGIGKVHAITMTDFCIDGGTIETASVRFENCEIESDIGSVAVDTDLIDVIGMDEGGLWFTANGGALTVDSGDFIDFDFNFKATAKVAGVMDFASLALKDFFVTGDGLIEIEDAIFDAVTLENLGNLFVEADGLFGNSLTDRVEFPPPRPMVFQEISLFVDSGFFGTAGIEKFDVTKAVPEPTTLILIGLGLAAFGLMGRRTKSADHAD